MKMFDLVMSKMTVDVMAEMLYFCENDTELWCSAQETEDGDIVCDKQNCKQCIKEWLQSDVQKIRQQESHS